MRYNVTITGQQKHITAKNNFYESQDIRQVEAILAKHWDRDYDKPQPDGNSYELNGDYTISIVPIKP